MSLEALKLGLKVKVAGKDAQGVIAFVGPTNFAPEIWIGLKLDEPKGKNNGSVQGVEYFKCEDKYGLFVKPSQVVLLDEHGKPTREKSSDSIARPRRQTSSRLSLGSSRQSLADSRQSLLGSRQSLADSRLSLGGSRTHLASLAAEKSDETPSQPSKRASFVETGFVETLKPQFTPGQAMTTTPITSIEDKINAIQMQQELENRTQKIQDLGEKLETMKIKRQEDKEKLKELDKLKIQLEQLIEFKSKIMEAQASLQRELQKAKQEARDAVEAKETHAEEVADLAEAVEMATLDREMAEEKAETLQLELEACREKLEEVTLDMKILKTELAQRGGGGGGASEDQSMSAYEIKQLQQQNARLRETLVRLRDLSAHDKHEYQKLIKDVEQKKSEIVELGRTKEKLSTRVEEMEQQLADLQEQVDAALGAEEMVVILGEQKLTLEDKVAQLREEVSELEALQDMNDQLVESNAELEAELREDLDMAQSATRQAQRDRDAALETIADREATIHKFRELVQKLQEQSLDLQERLEQVSSKPISNLPEILDFKKMFTETKAHTKAIDLELRSVDIQQLQSHIRYLTSYMPDSFMNRGGDHDAVLVLLLIPRMIHKSEILLTQIKDKFPIVDKIDRSAILRGHAVEQFSFRCRLHYYIFALQSVLHQYTYALDTCKTEALLKVGATYPEMAAQEKIIDSFIELVKRDQLDENVPTEALEKCVGYFSNLFPILLGPENRLHHSQLLSDNVKVLQSACDGINNDAMVIRSLIETANVGDIGLLAQHVITTVDHLQQQLKLVKRRLPPDHTAANIGLSSDTFENFQHCYQHSGKIIKTLQDIVKNSVHAMTSSGEFEKGLPQDKIKDVAANASDKVYEQDDLGPVQSIKNSLNFLTSQITQLAQFLQANEYEITSNRNEDKVLPPIQLRAESVKKELEQTKTLTSKLENKETDIKELRRAFKEKQEQYSQMTIRKELAEKKLGNVNKDYELTIEKLQRKLEEANNNYTKKEKEFEETLDHLQKDIDSLESEKGEMKEKLKLVTKKTQMELTKSVSGSQLSSMQSLGPSLPAVVRDSPLLRQEIDSLRKLFHEERNKRIKLENEELSKKLASLKPMPKFKAETEEVLDGLFREGADLKQEILMTLATPKFPTIYKVQAGDRAAAWKKHFAEENAKLLQLKMRANEFQSRVANEIVKRKMGGRVQADFAVFPTVEMTKALSENKPVNIGFIKIPLPANESPKMLNLELDFQNLQKVLQSLLH